MCSKKLPLFLNFMSYLCSIFVFVFFFLAMLVHMSVIWKITRKNICRSKSTQRPRFKPQVKHLNRKIWKNISTVTSSLWLPAKIPRVNKLSWKVTRKISVVRNRLRGVKSYVVNLTKGLSRPIMYEVWSKNNRYFPISWITYIRFSHFCFLLYWYTFLLYIYVDNIGHFGLSVCFWQIKRLVVFWCALRFFTISKKWIKEIVLSFV